MKKNQPTSAKHTPEEFRKLPQEEKERLVREYMKLSPEERDRLAREEVAALTPEEAEARRRDILGFGRELKMQLGRSILDANPGIFDKMH